MNRKTTNDFSELAVAAPLAAQRLLGAELTRIFDDGQQVTVRIVETEAYDQTDAASHSFKPQTPRTAVMFGPAGYLYVYFTYGLHYCMNVVCGAVGEGSAVLIRAIEPVSNELILVKNRMGKQGVDITNGPAKACQALQISKIFNGHDLTTTPLTLQLKPEIHTLQVIQTTRIGISQAKDVRWRFYIKENQYVSKR